MDGDVTLIENTKLVSVIKDLLSTSEENVEKALLYRTVATGRDVIEKQHTTQEASYGRDALAKVTTAVTRTQETQKQQHRPAEACGVVTFRFALFLQRLTLILTSMSHNVMTPDRGWRSVEPMYVGSCKTNTVGCKQRPDSLIF